MFYGHLFMMLFMLLQSTFAWNLDNNALLSYLPTMPTTTAHFAIATPSVQAAVHIATTTKIVTEVFTAIATLDTGTQVATTSRVITEVVEITIGHGLNLATDTDLLLIEDSADAYHPTDTTSGEPGSTVYVIHPTMVTARNGRSRSDEAVIATLKGEHYHPEPTPYWAAQIHDKLPVSSGRCTMYDNKI